jgi:uncharacterized spore protein YtfJ
MDQQKETVPQTMPKLPQTAVTDAASVNLAYGSPITANGRTVVPVAMVRMGFRGGFRGRRGMPMAPTTNGQHTDGQAEKQPVVGGGMMSRLAVRPIGFIDISDHRSRFVTIAPGRFVALGFGLAMLVSGLMGGLMRSRYRAMHRPT